MEKFDKLWKEYHDLFGEWFPTMCFPTDTEEQLAEKMETCVQYGQKAKEVYKLDYSEDVSY